MVQEGFINGVFKTVAHFWSKWKQNDGWFTHYGGFLSFVSPFLASWMGCSF
jgi:hypothetical protein